MVSSRRRPRLPTVERSIYFYRVRPRQTDDTLTFQDLGSAITSLSSTNFDSAGRYLDLPSGDSTCTWVDALGRPIRLRFGRTRRTGLPDIENRGRLSPLPVRGSAGLSELVHIVLWPNLVLGAEFNFYAPRVSSLSQYFREKTDLVPISFEMLVRPEVQPLLDNLRGVRLFHLKIRRSHSSLLTQIDRSLTAALDAAAEQVNAPVYELILRTDSRSRRPLDDKVISWLRNIFASTEIRENIQTLKINAYVGDDPYAHDIDLLKDFIVSKRHVVCLGNRRRSVQSASMYRAIEESYRELRDVLEAATGLETVD